MTDWLPGAERDWQNGGVTLDRSLPPRAVWHITWDALAEDGSQPDFDAVANYLKRMAYCPNLMWDPWTGRVVQFFPASVGGRALSAWNEDGSANIQIEVFFSPGAVRNGKRYDTVADTPCKGLAQILAWLDGFGIPREWPMGAPKWQGNSRDADIWNTRAGHYGHCNVPDNTHTDPGPMPSLALTNSGGVARPIPKPVAPAPGTTEEELSMNPMYIRDRANKQGIIYILSPISGKKRAIPTPEWNAIVNASAIAGTPVKVADIATADLKAIPNA